MNITAWGLDSTSKAARIVTRRLSSIYFRPVRYLRSGTARRGACQQGRFGIAGNLDPHRRHLLRFQ